MSCNIDDITIHLEKTKDPNPKEIKCTQTYVSMQS